MNRSIGKRVTSYSFAALCIAVTLFLTAAGPWELATPTAYAAEPEVLTSVNPQSGSADDPFTFIVTVNNVMTGVAPFLSGGEDFNLRLVGPQSSVRIVNGNVSSSIMYIYQLTAKKEGELMTPSAEVEIDGKKYAAPALKVLVNKDGNAGQAGTPGGNDKVFLKQVVTPATVYEGQQVVTALTLYTRVPLREIDVQDITYDDFWQESFGPEQRSTKSINGQNYTAVQLKRALYPLKAGKVTLPPRIMTAIMRSERGGGGWPFGDADDFPDDVFGGLFAGPGKQVTLKSNPVELEVKPLPPPPSSVKISGSPIVGKTSVKLNYSPDSIKAGAGKTVEIEVTSEGNLNPLRSLEINGGNSVRIYDEKPESQHDTRGPVLTNHKTFRFSIVPMRGGLIKVPPVTITYFDPELGKYATASTPPIAFPAEGPTDGTPPEAPVENSNTSNSPAASSAYAPIPTLPPVSMSDTPVTPYEEPSWLQRLGDRIPLSVAILVAVAVTLLIFGIWALIQWRAKVKPRTVDLSTVKNARDVRELNDSFRQFLATRFAIGGNHLTSDELRQALTQKRFPNEFTFEVGSLLDEFDLILYSGKFNDDPAALDDLKARVEKVILRTV